MLQISDRLTAVAALVTEQGTLADVGTDHGYIPVYLTGQKRIQRAIAMDINEGPLLRAEEHIRQYQMEQVIETRLSDGLSALREQEADTIVIAGMGGALMMRILEDGADKAESARELILQPQSELCAFRAFLYRQGYIISAEDMVYEDGKYYPMMRVHPPGKYSQSDSQTEVVQRQECRKERLKNTEELMAEDSRFRLNCKYGELLLADRHPVLLQYLKWQRKQKEEILGKIRKNAKQDAGSREAELLAELADIDLALEGWEQGTPCSPSQELLHDRTVL